jgi:hypothetical protein
VVTGIVLFFIAWVITSLWTCHSLIEVLILLCILGLVFLPVVILVGLTATEKKAITSRLQRYRGKPHAVSETK